MEIFKETFEKSRKLSRLKESNNDVFVYDGTQRAPEDVTKVVVKDGVTSIGNEAFRDCTSLTSITIPDSVTTIGGAAFSYCRSLTSVTIPDSVTSIGDHAFYGCHRLTSITIGDSVTSIGEWAFRYCESLTSVTIPDSVTYIGNGAFEDCYSLTSITLGDSVTSIGDYAFTACKRLKGVTIPDSVTSIGKDAFYRTPVESRFHEEEEPNKAEEEEWPEELTFEESDVGDQIESLAASALDKLDAWSEPSIQAGMGQDYIRSNKDDTVLAVIDYSSECDSLQDIYYGSSSKSDCIKQITNYFKKKIDEYEPEIEESVKTKKESKSAKHIHRIDR